ncbi:MAG: histidinol phosphatase-like enzyme (inositol monophosphatase family) [Kiritimatiellia bacterium]|jgi:histidinol phosphatase-like enzyme (inositol monophosphatase family)
MNELDRYKALANRLADAAALQTVPRFRTDTAPIDKGGHPSGYDPVTEADRQAEAAIRAILREEVPTHGILGEEFGILEGTAPWTWILDPIDGTRAFVSGFPSWGTLIGLMHDGAEREAIIGIIDQPWLKERWVGTPQGTTLDDRQGERAVHVRPCADIGDAIFSSTTPALFISMAERAAFTALMARTRFHRMGADCYAYGLLACGFVDLIVECQLEPYDLGGVIPVVRGAGGIITSWEGTSPVHGGTVVAAGDPRVHAQALELLRATGATR